MIYTYPNNSDAVLDYIYINKTWINSVLNCETYSLFKEVSSDLKIVSAKIHLSLHRNKKQAGKASQYYWP